MKSLVKFAAAIFALILLLRAAQHVRRLDAVNVGHFVANWATLLGAAFAVLLAFAMWREVRR